MIVDDLQGGPSAWITTISGPFMFTGFPSGNYMNKRVGPNWAVWHTLKNLLKLPLSLCYNLWRHAFNLDIMPLINKGISCRGPEVKAADSYDLVTEVVASSFEGLRHWGNFLPLLELLGFSDSDSIAWAWQVSKAGWEYTSWTRDRPQKRQYSQCIDCPVYRLDRAFFHCLISMSHFRAHGAEKRWRIHFHVRCQMDTAGYSACW